MARLLTELADANKLLGEKEATFKTEFEDAAAQHELEIEQLKTQLIEAEQAEQSGEHRQVALSQTVEAARKAGEPQQGLSNGAALTEKTHLLQMRI